MKILIGLKMPDAVNEAAREAAERKREELNLQEIVMDWDDVEMLVEQAYNEVVTAASSYFQYGESLTVELDTVAKTCTVKEV